MRSDEETLIIEELNNIFEGKADPKSVAERKETFDSLISSLIQAKVLDKQAPPALTGTFQQIWEQLKILQNQENHKQILQNVSGFNEDLDLLENALKDGGEVEEQILDLVDRIYAISVKIILQAEKCWEEGNKGEYSKKYFDLAKIDLVVGNLDRVLDRLVQSTVENLKWPLQMYDLCARYL